MVLSTWDPCWEERNIVLVCEGGNSERYIDETQVCATLLHHFHHVGIVSENQDRFVLEEINERLQAVK